MKLVRSIKNGQEVFIDEVSGVHYAPIQSSDPVTLPAQQAVEVADAVRHILDTLHDNPRIAQTLVNYAIEPILGQVNKTHRYE